MPQVRNPVPVVVFIFFIIWLFTPGDEYPAQSLLLSDIAEERIAKFHHALNVLNQSHWGGFYPEHTSVDGDDTNGEGFLNLTGFRGALDGYTWENLGSFREKSLEISRYAVQPVDGEPAWRMAQGEPVWTNVSGVVQGEWVRSQGPQLRSYDSFNLTESVPGFEWMGDQSSWARNITGDSGKLLLRVDGNHTIETYDQLSPKQAMLGGGLIRNIRGTATVEDTTGSGHTWDMRLWGVHWPRQGVIMLTTTSEKFEGLFGLPHLTPSADFFQSSQRLLNATLQDVISRKEQNILVDQNIPWNSDIDNPLYSAYPAPHCELVVYAQVHPSRSSHLQTESADELGYISEEVIHAIESELEHPIGAPISKIPRLQVSAVVYSPDCGFILESKGPPHFPPGEAHHLVGLKNEVHVHQIKTWLLVYALVVSGQVYLLKDQMRETFTPSTMGRVSFWTTSIMVIADGITFLAATTWVSSAAATFLPTLALMFASFLSMTIGGSFLGKIFEVQAPEDRARRGADQPTAPPTTTVTPSDDSETSSDSNGPLLPGPVTAPRSSNRQALPPVIVPFDQDVEAEAQELTAGASAVPGTARGGAPGTTPPPPRRTFQDIIVRYMFAGLCISALAISSSTWYPRVRSIFMNVCAMSYLSLWIPQIHRNVIRNCRRALKWRFVIGQSLLRLFPVAYFWISEDNFLFAETDQRAFAVLGAWLWIQIFILAVQDFVGPRFGVPAGWAPEAWDYHPVLREDGLEAGGLPIGLMADDNPGLERTGDGEDDGGKKRSSARTIDCAICTELLEVAVVRADDELTSVANAFARRLYMVTPCRHIFHAACLEGWMKYRLQCPICREDLPPL